MIIVRIHRVPNHAPAGTPPALGSSFSFTFIGPSFQMIPQTVIDKLIDLDAALSEAETRVGQSSGGNAGGGIPAGAVVLTTEDVDNLNADLQAKAERARAIGTTPAPAEGAPQTGTTGTTPPAP